MSSSTVLVGPLARPVQDVEPPTALAVVALLVVAGLMLVLARRSWRTAPEDLGSRTEEVVVRPGPAYLAYAAMFLWMAVVSAVAIATGDAAAVEMLFLVGAFVPGVAGVVYTLAYFTVRLPDAALPPPQRGRGGQWNDPDGRPLR